MGTTLDKIKTIDNNNMLVYEAGINSLTAEVANKANKDFSNIEDTVIARENLDVYSTSEVDAAITGTNALINNMYKKVAEVVLQVTTDAALTTDATHSDLSYITFDFSTYEVAVPVVQFDWASTLPTGKTITDLAGEYNKIVRVVLDDDNMLRVYLSEAVTANFSIKVTLMKEVTAE